MGIPSDKDIIESFTERVSNTENTGWDYWRQWEVRDGYRFFFGLEQWEESTRRELERRGLKPITFNRLPPFINSVNGEVTRLAGQTRYFPTEGGEDYTDVANDAVKWAMDKSNEDHYKRLALKDAEICGLGCIEQTIDYTNNPNGLPLDARVHPIEVLPDWDAEGTNLSDGRFFIRAKFLPVEVFEKRFKKSIEPGNFNFDFTFANRQFSDQNFFVERFNLRGSNFNTFRHNAIMIFDYQFKEIEDYKRIQNPFKNVFSGDLEPQKVESKEDPQANPSAAILQQRLETDPVFAKLLQTELEDLDINVADDVWSVKDNADVEPISNLLGIPLDVGTAQRDRYYRAFMTGQGNSGAQIIEKGDGPMKTKFSYSMINAFWDDEKRSPYGYVRLLKDPQRVANSSFMHIFHSTLSAPKPTVIAEKDAVEDPDVFERQIADRQSVAWIEEGATGKFTPYNPPAQPTGFEAPLNISVNAFVETSGINLNFNATDDTEISGILDRQRNEKSAVTLVDVIENYRYFMKELGQGNIERLAQLAENVPGRLITVVGEDGINRIQLLEEVFATDYEVVIDEADPSVTQQMENTKQLAELLKAGFVPEEMQNPVLMEIFENSGISKETREELKEISQARAQQAAQLQQVEAARQQAVQQLIEAGQMDEIERVNAAADELRSRIILNQAKAEGEVADAEKTMADRNQKIIENQAILSGVPQTVTFNI